MEGISQIERIRGALERERPRLFRVVRGRVASDADADEVLQIAAERALARSEQLRDPSRAEAWLGRVVRNVLYDELRRRRSAPEPVDADALELAPIEDDPIDCTCVLVQAEKLEPDHAEILRRVVLDGVPVTEAAAALGITPNNAMVRLHRARKALRKRLEQHCGTTSAAACSDCGCAERRCCPPAS